MERFVVVIGLIGIAVYYGRQHMKRTPGGVLWRLYRFFLRLILWPIHASTGYGLKKLGAKQVRNQPFFPKQGKYQNRSRGRRKKRRRY